MALHARIGIGIGIGIGKRASIDAMMITDGWTL
jgi:hypothetical protein